MMMTSPPPLPLLLQQAQSRRLRLGQHHHLQRATVMKMDVPLILLGRTQAVVETEHAVQMLQTTRLFDVKVTNSFRKGLGISVERL